MSSINHAIWAIVDFLQTYNGAMTAATIVIAAFTTVLGVFTVKLAYFTKKSVRIAERALTDLERPYIYIFGAKGVELESGNPNWFLKYSVANYGRTPATIETISTKISVGALPENPAAIAGWHCLLATPILTPNGVESDIREWFPDGIDAKEYTDEYTQRGEAWMPDLKDGESFYFWIKIKYRGPFTWDHETSACWRWERSRLALYSGDQYNYTR